MATLPDIDSREKLEAWLQDKPREWAQVIASRAALRVLPRVGDVFRVPQSRLSGVQKRELVLQVCRANLVATVAVTQHSDDIEKSAGTAFFRISTVLAAADTTAAGAADAAADAAYAASNAAVTAVATAHDAALASSRAATFANAATAGITIDAVISRFPFVSTWGEVVADAVWLTNRLEQRTGAKYDRVLANQHVGAMLSDLVGTRLWAGSQPDWVDSELTNLAQHLRKDGDWHHWMDWYYAQLDGLPFGLHPQLAGKLRDEFDDRVATQPDGWWERGADAVNADIARWIAEETERLATRNDGEDPDSDDLDDVDDLTRIYELGPELDDYDPYEPQEDGEDATLERAAELIGALEQSRAGLPIEVEGDELRIGATGAAGDLEAAANRLTRQLHGEVIPLARDFAELAMRLDNRHGWTGIGRAASRLADFLAQGPEAVADNIGLVWVDSVRLGSFLEQDTAILAGKSEIADPLVAEDRRKLSDLVTVAAPYVRRYPSARELDAESRAFKASDTLIAEGRAIIGAAQQSGLLNRQDGRTIEAIFDTATQGGVQGHKAGSVAVETARNVVIKTGAVVATLYVGAVLGAAAPHSVLISRGVETFLTSEKAIIELVKDMPDDIGIAYRILLDGLKDPSILPSRPRLMRRREDEARLKDE